MKLKTDAVAVVIGAIILGIVLIWASTLDPIPQQPTSERTP